MSKEIGRKLKQLRKEKGITQEEAAKRLKITRSTISNYEVGRRSPHLKDLQKIGDFYGAGLEFSGLLKPTKRWICLFVQEKFFQVLTFALKQKRTCIVNL